MSRICLVLLSIFFLCSAASIRSHLDIAVEKFSIQDSKPAEIVQAISNERLWFLKNTTSGISFSAILENGQKLTTDLKGCNIKNADMNTTLINLYDFVQQDLNTQNYANSILVDCSNGTATGVVFVAQSQKDVGIFDTYKVYHKVIPPTTVAGTKQSTGFTLITTGMNSIYVVDATFTAGKSFKYGLGTPEVTPLFSINSTTKFPYYIPHHQMTTTFYFNGADVSFDIRGGYIPQNCSGVTIIDQNQLGNGTFMFPSIANTYQLYNTPLSCSFKIITKGMQYVPQIQMSGLLSDEVKVSITPNNGYGVYYGPMIAGTESDYNYRGAVLPNLYFLPTDGVIEINANNTSKGFFRLQVSFVEMIDNRNTTLKTFYSTTRVSLNEVNVYKYQMVSTNAGAPLISLSIAPSLPTSVGSQNFDLCFLNVLKDRSVSNIPIARYSLRQFTEMNKPVYFTNGIITCLTTLPMYGFMVIRVNTEANFKRIGATMARIGVDERNIYTFPPNNNTGPNILTILVENRVQESKLFTIGSPNDSPVIIHNGDSSGSVSATVHSKDLPNLTPGSIISYEAPPEVTYLDIMVKNSGPTLIFNSLLLLVAGYFLH